MGKRVIFPDYKAKHDTLICIDSDGCAFDTMEIKHKECFCPATILMWKLQPVAKYVREIWEYTNLYSMDRGRSRFHELELLFDWLERRAEVQEREIQLPDITSFRQWLETAPILNNEALKEQTDDPILKQTLEWSLECNRRIKEMVFGIPPFPKVRESLKELSKNCDIAIVSATAREALRGEWTEHDLMQYVHVLGAQEDGTKKECIQELKEYYAQGRVLMMGDAVGDMEAAHENGTWFYPIRPGEETQSWKEFYEQEMKQFLTGKYGVDEESRKIARFLECLPEKPPWELKK